MDTSIRIIRDENGIWHWIYRLPMFHNFSILRTVVVAMEAVYAVMLLFSVVIIYINNSTLSRSRGFIFIMFGVGVLILLLAVICYFAVAAIFGGYYIFVYTMDEIALSVTQPVSSLVNAAKQFEPEEDRTYSSAKISTVDISTRNELGDLSREIQLMQARIVENAGSLKKMTAERERISTELDLAARIQKSMLPCTFPPFPERDHRRRKEHGGCICRRRGSV